MINDGSASTSLRFLPGLYLAAALHGGVACILPIALSVAMPMAAQEMRPGLQVEREAAFAQVMAQLIQGGKDRAPRELDEEATPQLLEKAWTLAADWAVAHLNAHPGLPASTLAKDLEAMAEHHALTWKGKQEKALQVESLRLGKGTYVLGLTSAPAFAGTFLVLDRGPGGFQVAWRILDLAQAHIAQQDSIGHWAFRSSRGYGSGPLYGRLHALPRDAAGRPRFLVVAIQNADGNEGMGQLGFWAWNGSQAQPLLVEDYWQAIDLRRVRFLPDRVVVDTKEHLRTMFSCSPCPEPQGTWVVDVNPKEVLSRPHRFQIPEYPAVDELFARILHRDDASGLAAPAVIAALKALIPPFDAASDTGDYLPFGMLEGAQRVCRGNQIILRLTFDDLTFGFTMEQRAGRPYFTTLETKRLDGEGDPGPP